MTFPMFCVGLVIIVAILGISVLVGLLMSHYSAISEWNIVNKKEMK